MNRVFVLGSGFSKCCGMPLGGSELFSQAFSEEEDAFLDRYAIISYALPIFFPDFNVNQKNFPDIEYFCTLLLTKHKFNDLILANAGQGKEYIFGILNRVKQQLGVFFSEKQKEIGDNFKNIEYFSAKLRYNDTILTFNYDTLLEKAILKKRGNIISYLQEHNTITILKLHGSISWINNEILNTLRPQRLDLFTQLEDIHYVKNFESAYNKYTDFPGHALIDPTYFKEPNTEMLKKVWKQSKDVLEKADEIIVIGYSLPDADFFARCLLQCANNSHKKKIEIINKDRKVESRFKRVFGEINFVESSFETSIYGSNSTLFSRENIDNFRAQSNN